MEGWRVASKGLWPLPRIKRGALAHGCGRGGRAVLPLGRATTMSPPMSRGVLPLAEGGRRVNRRECTARGRR